MFDLSESKFLTMAQMFNLGWGEAWKWRRRLWAWEEEMVDECRTLLLTIVLQVDIGVVWAWIPNPFVVIQSKGLIASSQIGCLPVIMSLLISYGGGRSS